MMCPHAKDLAAANPTKPHQTRSIGHSYGCTSCSIMPASAKASSMQAVIVSTWWLWPLVYAAETLMTLNLAGNDIAQKLSLIQPSQDVSKAKISIFIVLPFTAVQRLHWRMVIGLPPRDFFKSFFLQNSRAGLLDSHFKEKISLLIGRSNKAVAIFYLDKPS